MTRVRLLLAKHVEDTEPTIVGAVDEAIWEHWVDAEEAAWIKAGKKTWGLSQPDTEFKVAVAVFAPQQLVDVFDTPEVTATIESA